jgi:hypothetical protein
MSPSTIDRNELEDRLRSALRARAATTEARPPERFVPGPTGSTGSTGSTGGRSSRRRALVLGAAAVAAGVLAIAAVALTRDDGHDGNDVSTRPPSPEEEGLGVNGPSGSRWFVLDLPGVTPTSASVEDRGGQSIRAGQSTTLQAFRTDDGFAGPALWVETTLPGQDLGPEQDGPGVTRATVQGRTATVSEFDGSVTLSWPGGPDEGFYIIAVHMSVDDVVAFADGLRARGNGEGWDATELPRGLGEIPPDAGDTSDEIYAEWSYSGPFDANYELFVNPGGASVFENWAREHAVGARSVEPLTVGGRPGVVIETESETVVVWRPTDTAVADFRISGTVDLVSDLQGLRPVDEAAWLDHLPPTIRPQMPG